MWSQWKVGGKGAKVKPDRDGEVLTKAKRGAGNIRRLIPLACLQCCGAATALFCAVHSILPCPGC